MTKLTPSVESVSSFFIRVVFDNCQFALSAPACGACDGLPTLIPNTPASYVSPGGREEPESEI